MLLLIVNKVRRNELKDAEVNRLGFNLDRMTMYTSIIKHILPFLHVHSDPPHDSSTSCRIRQPFSSVTVCMDTYT